MTVKAIAERSGNGFYVFESVSTNQDGDTVCVGTWTTSCEARERCRPATQIPELKVTPDKYLTVRYAGASGDFNPIHIDEEFAKQVGLPGRILHGLWTMAQVARAQTEAGGGPHSLRRLQVQFRGMGLPEQELTVTGHGPRAARRRRGRAHRGRAGRQGDHPQRRGRDRGRVALRRVDLQSVWCSRRAKS